MWFSAPQKNSNFFQIQATCKNWKIQTPNFFYLFDFNLDHNSSIHFHCLSKDFEGRKTELKDQFISWWFSPAQKTFSPRNLLCFLPQFFSKNFHWKKFIRMMIKYSFGLFKIFFKSYFFFNYSIQEQIRNSQIFE